MHYHLCFFKHYCWESSNFLADIINTSSQNTCLPSTVGKILGHFSVNGTVFDEVLNHTFDDIYGDLLSQ